MVTVTGRHDGRQVSASWSELGRLSGDADLLAAVFGLVRNRAQVYFWPLGNAVASVGGADEFAITVASLLEPGSVTIKGLDAADDEHRR